jgi:transcriptional regulator with XRE-family HTH domain
MAMKTLADLGAEFQTLRRTARMTQQQLAAAAGMHQENVSRFERARGNDFSVAKLLRMLQVMGYDLQFTPSRNRPTLKDVLVETRNSANTGPMSR